MIQLLLAIFLVVHGTLHLVGVAAPWRLAAIGHLEVAEGFFGHIRISDDEARALGVVWVLVAIAFIGAGIGMLFGADIAFG